MVIKLGMYSRKNETRRRNIMKKLFLPYLIALLLIGGSTLLVYPSAASWKAQLDQSKVVNAYSDQVEHAHPDKENQMKAAREYNAALNAGAVLEANERKATGTGELTSDSVWPYEDILKADTHGLMARIRIEKIDVDLPIFHGTTDETLLKGAGHLEGTSFPIGGASAHAVITAHRGLAQARMFTDLDKIDTGDAFTIEVFGEVLTYRVRETKIVQPEDTDTLKVEEGSDLVTLVTCTPLGINSHRILVTGERIIPTPQADLDAAGNSSQLPRFPWFAVLYVGGVIATLVWVGYVTFALYSSQRKQRAR